MKDIEKVSSGKVKYASLTGKSVIDPTISRFGPYMNKILGISNGNYVSVNSNWVHPLGQPPGISSKSCLGGRDLAFESFPGAGNSTRTEILWKMKVKLKKNSVDQIFTGENKNKQADFLPFSRFTCCLNGIFPGLWVNFLVLL